MGNLININHRQVINQWLFGILLVFSLFYPLYGLLCIVGYPLFVSFQKGLKKQKRKLISFIIFDVMLFLGIVWQIFDTNTIGYYFTAWFSQIWYKILSIFNHIEYQVPIKEMLLAWLVAPLGWKLIPNSAIMLVVILTDSPIIWRAENEMLQEAQKKHDSKTSEKIHVNVLPLVADPNHPHILEVGMTGMGKSTAIYDYVEFYLAKKRPVIMVSGKKSTESKESMITALRERCRYYGRKLYIVSFDPNIKDRRAYNIFQGMTETQLVDCLAMVSDFSDAYYESVMRNWVKALALVMKKYGIEYSLQNLIDCWDWEVYTEMLEELLTDGRISENEYRSLIGKDMKQNCNTSIDSVARYKQFTIGEEAFVLCGENPINISMVRNENAVIYIDLDSHSYGEFTKVVGRFVISDIARCIANEDYQSSEERKLIVLDEVQSYATEKMESLYTQSRSAGYSVISATQTPSEFDKVSPTLQRTIIGNCGTIICFRLTNADDRELIAKAVGSEEAVNVTNKSDITDLAGAGTLKMGHEFKLNPDDIIKLEKLQAYVIDFNRNTVKKYKFSWVPLHEKVKQWRK